MLFFFTFCNAQCAYQLGRMTLPTADPFSNVRKQAQRALGAVLNEIRRREADLHRLVEQAERWRAALGGTGQTPAAAGTKRAGGKKASRKSPEVDWDAVLGKLPDSFTPEDVAKRTPKLAKYPKARVMALARWSRGKQIKKVGEGKYRKT